jgi:flagellar motility protein MotE (MotC chaperone)
MGRGAVNYEEIEHLRTRHAAWRLLSSTNVALVLSFLSRVFVDGNGSNIAARRLIDELDDEIFALNQRLNSGGDDEPRFPRPAKDYLDDWASNEKGWLRRFYPPGSDEPHYDLTPAVERALAWVDGLQVRSFIGTESRLTTIFELLRQMVRGADEDPTARLADLERRGAAIDAEIAQVKSGYVQLADSVTQRDRYQQFARTARELLSDFRQVEENFRGLDRDLREQIALWEGSKGDLLEDLFTNRRGITDSDQGRSFRAFYDLLLSSEKQNELADLLRRLHEIGEIEDLDPRLARVHYDWIEASERTQVTVRRLSEQLRRFLDDQVWMENRRVFDLLHAIEVKAIRARDFSGADSLDSAVRMDVEGMSVPVALPMERPLYKRVRITGLAADPVDVGVADLDRSQLFDQLHVDRDALLVTVLERLGARHSIRLDEVVSVSPIENGLAELIGYLSIDEPDLSVEFDGGERMTVKWVAERVLSEGRHSAESADTFERVADLPVVTIVRGGRNCS